MTSKKRFKLDETNGWYIVLHEIFIDKS